MAGNMLLLQNTYDVLYSRAESRKALKYQAQLLADTVMLNLCYLGPQHHIQELQISNKRLLTSVFELKELNMVMKSLQR